MEGASEDEARAQYEEERAVKEQADFEDWQAQQKELEIARLMEEEGLTEEEAIAA